MQGLRIEDSEIGYEDFSLREGYGSKKYTIAGLTAEVRADNPSILEGLGSAWEPFCSPDSKPDFVVETKTAQLEGLPEDRALIRRFVSGRRLFLEYFSLRGMIDGARRTGRVVLKSGEQQSLETFLRNCYAFFLPENRGFLVHASSLADETGGYVFFGRSGAGKTTLALNNRKNALILSDEITAIKKTAEGFRVFGTPFWGSMKKHHFEKQNNTVKRINGIFLLRKRQKNYMKVLPAGLAVANLMACVFHHTTEEKKTERLFALCNELVRSVGVFELGFTKNFRLGNLNKIKNKTNG